MSGRWAGRRTWSPVEYGPTNVKRKRMGEESYDTHQELWEKYMEVEY
jgi:hypothetical protein